MKKNTWVFYFFIILFAGLLSVNLVWRFTPVKSEIRDKIIAKLRPFLGDSLKIGDFSPGFGYLSFYDVSAGSKDQDFSFHIDEIQVGYSLHKLLLNKMNPLRVIETITFKNPAIIFRTYLSNGEKKSPNDSLDLTQALKGFQNLTEVDRIFIQGGQILWEKSPAMVSEIVTTLDGIVLVKGDSLADLNLNGNLFASKNQDIKLEGMVDFSRTYLDIQAQINQSELQQGLPFIDGESFSIKDAVLNGVVRITSPSFKINDLRAAGELEVRNMSAILFGQNLRTDDYQIRFDGQKMLLTEVSGTVEDGRFVLKGDLGEIFHPALNFDIDFENYSARYIAISAPILEQLNKGKFQGHLDIEGPKSEITVSGRLYSSKLYYNIVPFYRSSLDFIYQDKLWTFRKINTHAIGMDHSGTAQIDFSQNNVDLSLYSTRYLEPGLFSIIDRLNDTNMEYRTSMHGEFHNLTFAGVINAFFVNHQDTVLTTSANYTLVDDRIQVKSMASYPAGMSIYAEATKLWDDPTFKILRIENVCFDSLSTLKPVHWLSSKFDNDFYFAGPVNFPTTRIKFTSKNTKETFFSLSGSTLNLIKPHLKFNGKFTVQTIPDQIAGQIKVEDSDNQVQIHLVSPNITKGELLIGKGEDAALSGHLDINEFKALNFIEGLPSIYAAISEGDLSGKMQISGTNRRPVIDFDLRGDNFIINRNGYYSAHFKGTYRPSALQFETAEINYNNRPIIAGQFDLDLVSKQMQAFISGNNIESNFVAATIFKNTNLIRGNLAYELSLTGDMQRPQISGSILLQQGYLEDRAFNNVNIVFEDSIPPTSGLFNLEEHVFKILKFIYVNQKNYTLEADGLIPVNPKLPLDLHLTVCGNVLAELPDVISFIRNPDCIGELVLHVDGSRGNPQLLAGSLNIYNGSMEFESVLLPLKDIKAEIELSEGTQFINIKNLAGKFGTHWVRVHNIPANEVESISLQPWYFEDLGLNFGVLEIETDPEGIPLSIPGLMNPGDMGYFAAAGRTPSEELYFAGPVALPHVRGKIKLLESRITFPFLETDSGEEEDNRVVEFLMNTHWDVQVVPGLGNRYFVDIPALIGMVYLDLNIDDVSKGLIFTGRLVDESFRVEGSVESTRGRVEYLDMTFRVERFGAEFSRFELYPQVYGRALTTVRTESDFPKDVYLVLYAIDPETNQEISRGRWEDFRFKLESNDPNILFSSNMLIDETQEDILSYMGYSVGNLPNKAGDVGLTLTENYLIRPLVRPLERRLERDLRLDYVRLRSNITSNLLYYGFQDRFKFLQNPVYYQPGPNNNLDPALLLLQSSEITLGKYLVRDIYFTYSGQLVSVYDESRLGLNHTFGIEYRLLRNLLLELEYDKFQYNPVYYSRDALHDFRIRLRHSFNF